MAIAGVWARAKAETIRQPRDRLTGQPQERQRSAADFGGTRDRLPPARVPYELREGSLPKAETPRALTKKDLLFVHQKGSHRYFADPLTGKIVTTLPMHPGDLPRWLLKTIIKEVGLSEDEFRSLL